MCPKHRDSLVSGINSNEANVHAHMFRPFGIDPIQLVWIGEGGLTATTAAQQPSSPGRDRPPEAADRGLYVTWEIEPGFAFNKPSDVLRILDAIPDDTIG